MEFIFATCQTGAEPALKRELSRLRPELHFAYSRPGYVTFKWTGGPFPGVKLELESVFARAYGQSHGRLGEKGEPVEQLVARVVARAGLSGARRLHVFEREGATAREADVSLAAAARAAILAHGSFDADPMARPGEKVLDVIVVDEGEWWLGEHIHSEFHSAFPGGIPPIALPPEAPSRAYLKLEEMLAWSGFAFREGDIAVEVGSAPGGASYALLQRGLSVVGIDTGAMDPVVLRFGDRFNWVRRGVEFVQPSDLPKTAQWILVDMNVPAAIALKAAARLASFYPDSLLGFMLTLKINHWRMADEIPLWFKRACKDLGLVAGARVAQLPAHRQEVGLVGLTRLGARRGT